MGMYLMRAATLYAALAVASVSWSWLVPTVAEDVLGLAAPPASGSGDTSWHYVQLGVDLVLACAGAVVWTTLSRNRRVVAPLLMFAVRVYLFKGMIAYGLMKVFKTQFPEPSLVKLTTTFGESSPMGVLWAFMGVSTPYCIFTGLVELVGAILLVSRRTSTLGAVVLLGAMSNVVMLNLCYDVPVKQHALHYLAGAMFLVAADGQRLVRFFVLDREVAPRKLEPIFVTPRLQRLGQVAKWVAAASVMLSGVATVTEMRARFFDVEPPALYGIWEVEQFQTDREPTSAWTQLVLAERGRASLRTSDGQRWALRTKSDGSTLKLEPRSAQGPTLELAYLRPHPQRLTLHGDGIHVDLRRVDEAELPLRNPGFHWVTDEPNHRWR